jgi:hypothetical protein
MSKIAVGVFVKQAFWSPGVRHYSFWQPMWIKVCSWIKRIFIWKLPYIMTWPCNLVTRRKHILSLLCLYLKPTSLLASNRASVPYFMTWNKKLTYQLHVSGNFLRSQQYAQIVKKFSAFYWIQSFIAVITRPATGSYRDLDESNPYPSTRFPQDLS